MSPRSANVITTLAGHRTTKRRFPACPGRNSSRSTIRKWNWSWPRRGYEPEPASGLACALGGVGAGDAAAVLIRTVDGGSCELVGQLLLYNRLPPLLLPLPLLSVLLSLVRVLQLPVESAWHAAGYLHACEIVRLSPRPPPLLYVLVAVAVAGRGEPG